MFSDCYIGEKELKDINVLITAAGNVFMPGTTACLKKMVKEIFTWSEQT